MKKIIIAAILTVIIVVAFKSSSPVVREKINFKDGTSFASEEKLKQLFSDPSAKRYVVQVFGLL